MIIGFLGIALCLLCIFMVVRSAIRLNDKYQEILFKLDFVDRKFNEMFNQAFKMFETKIKDIEDRIEVEEKK